MASMFVKLCFLVWCTSTITTRNVVVVDAVEFKPTSSVISSPPPPPPQGIIIQPEAVAPPNELPPSSPATADGPVEAAVATSYLQSIFKRSDFSFLIPFPTLRRIFMSKMTSRRQSRSSSKETESKDEGFGLSLRESISAITSYLILGIISYHYAIQCDGGTNTGGTAGKSPSSFFWSIIDSLYFSVVTFTTVGYGDITPTTNIGKIVTLLFGLVGISLLGIAIGTIGHSFMERQNQMMNVANEDLHILMKKIDQLAIKLQHRSKKKNNTTKEKIESYDQGQEKELSPSPPLLVSSTTPSQSLFQQILSSLFQISTISTLALLLLGGILMGRIEDWSYVDSIYYSIITSCTLGYGDYYPKTHVGKLYAIIYIPVAVAITGEILSIVANTVIEYRKQQYYNKLLFQKELNLDRLLAMDTNRNGQVSFEEYIEYLLTEEMNLVTPKQYQQIKESFHKLDIDHGGYLDQHDISSKLAISNEK